MAGTTINGRSEAELELLDQMLEDLAGEELGEFEDDLLELDSELDVYSETDHFAEIDSFH